MTDKQMKFCEEYLISGNAADAARKAGYSEKTARSIGQRLLTYVDIAEYLREQSERISAEKIASAEEVLQYFTSVLRDQAEGTSDRVKCGELLAKRYGILSERLNVTGSVPVVICGEEALKD